MTAPAVFDDLNKKRITANLQKMAAAGATEAEMDAYMQSESSHATPAPAAPSSGFIHDINANADATAKAFGETSAKLFNTADRAASWLNETSVGKFVNEKLGASGGAFGKSRDFLQKKADEIHVDPLAETASINQRLDRALAEFTGAALPMIAGAEVAGAALNPLATATLGRGAGAAATALGATQKVANATAAATSVLPSSITAVAAFGPEELKTPAGALAVILPSAIEGIGAFLQTAKGIRKLATDPNSRVASKDLVKAVDDFRNQFETLTNSDPLKTAGLEPAVQLEKPTIFGAKKWNPEIASDTRIPAGEEYDYFRKEAAKLYDKQRRYTDEIRKLLKEDAGAFTEDKMNRLAKLQQKLQGVSDDFNQFVNPWLQRSASEQSGLKFSANDDPQTIIRFGKNTEQNFPAAGPTKSRLIATEPAELNKDLTWSSNQSAPIPRGPVIPHGSSTPSPAYDVARADMNIVYELPDKPSIPAKQKFYDRTASIGEISPVAQKWFNNSGSSSIQTELFLKHELSLPIGNAIEGQTMVVDGMPLQKVLDKLGRDKYRPLAEYLKASRQLADPSIPVGIKGPNPIATAQAIVDGASPEIKAAAVEYKKTTDAIVDWYVKGGIWSEELGKEFKAEFYAPGRAVFENPMGYNSGAKRVGNFSEKPTYDPIRQTAENVRTAIERFRDNVGWQQVIKDFEANPTSHPDWIKQIPADPHAVEAIAAPLRAAGKSAKQADALAKAQLMGQLDRSTNTLNVFKNGELFQYKIHPILADAKNALNPLELSGFQEAMRMFSRPLRESVALANDLSGVGPISDMVRGNVALAQHGLASNPIMDGIINPIRSALQIAVRGPELKEAARAGLNIGARGRPSEYIQPKVPFLEKLTTKPIKTIGNLPGDAMAAANDLIQPLNTMTRLSLYRAAVKGGYNPTEAASFANEAMGNWNKMGSMMRGYSATVAFGNYGIQTAAKDLEIIKEVIKKPVSVGVPALGAGFMYITVPTLASYFGTLGDEEIQRIRKADNYDNLYFRNPFTGDISKMKVPGWGLGPFFGGAVMAALDGMDEEARKRLATTFYNSYGVNMIPTPIQAVAGVAYNQRSPFSDAPIVPRKEAGIDPAVQGSEGVSKMSQHISQAVPVSPYKIDFLMDRLLGPLGTDLVQLAEGKVGGKRDIPVFSRWSVSDKAQTEGSNLFYNDLDKAQQAVSTMKRMAMDQNPNAEAYRQGNEQALGTYTNLANAAKSIGSLQTYINYVARDSDMTQEEKDRIISERRKALNDFFAMYAEIHKQQKAPK